MAYPLPNKRAPKKRMAEINVVPYIDVMLVLLVIFMITAPLLSEGYQVTLPQANAKPIKTPKQKPIVISVDRKGRLFVNLGKHSSQPVTAEKLVKSVLQRREKYPDIPILIKGDNNVAYGKVILAMSLLNDAGIDKFDLVVRPVDK